MKHVNVHEAKTHLSKLLEEVAAGEEIVICKAGKPVATLITFEKGERLKKRVPGSLKGQIWMAPDFDAPLPEEILAAFRGERP
jgi:prevent-host-death family protein